MGSDKETSDTSLFFTDGWVVSRDKVLIAAKMNSLAEEYFSRVLYFWEQQWFTTDITDSVHSVCFDPVSQYCLWLGQAGTITAKRRGESALTETIPDADRYGNLNRIRPIGGQLYICGYGGQVYRREANGWIHIDGGVLVSNPDARSVDLLDIDGSGPDNIYAVGTGGRIFHYDGRHWRSLDSPTNAHLTRVRCISSGELYVCGFQGTFFRGYGKAWQNLGTPELADNLYGLEAFQDCIYLARNSGLLRWSGESLSPVDMGISKVATFHRLHANDGVLWSFGTDNLFCFDGSRWTELVPPHNRP